MFNLNGKVCVVTGGNKGIGRGIVENFAKAGAKVVYALGRDEAALKEVESLFPNVKGIKLDVTDVAGIKAFVASIKEEHANIDVLVNNAGITRDTLIQRMTDDDWNQVLDINLKGLFNMSREIAPVMMKAGVGSIINISSVVGIDGNIGQTNYAAAKGGVIAMTKSWAKEFARKGAQVRVNCIAPGFTQTDMIKTVPDKILEAIAAKIMLQKLGTIEDIANGCLYLACDASQYVTAQTLRIDGGMIFGI
ncbi:MAG: 3-oxoacyl-ACP reductase FabG [Fusobacteria bacterium]|nr:3-oxoacyl-ACP reductase FabG [Fusobacteriota bacterium]